MGERQSVSLIHSLLLSVQVFKMESHTKRFLRIFLSSSATFLQYLQSSSSSSFSGHTPPFLPSHFFIQGSYSGSLVFSALDEKEQESEFVAVNPARRSHRCFWIGHASDFYLFRFLSSQLSVSSQYHPNFAATSVVSVVVVVHTQNEFWSERQWGRDRALALYIPYF